MVCLIMRGKPVQRRDAIGLLERGALPGCATCVAAYLPLVCRRGRKIAANMIGLLERIAAENISTLRLG